VYPVDGIAKGQVLKWVFVEDLNTTVMFNDDDGLVDVVRQTALHHGHLSSFEIPSPFFSMATTTTAPPATIMTTHHHGRTSRLERVLMCDTVGRVTHVTLRGKNNNTDAAARRSSSKTTWRSGGTIPLAFVLLTDRNGLKMVPRASWVGDESHASLRAIAHYDGPLALDQPLFGGNHSIGIGRRY
jgi:hypothetical protein